MQVTYNGESDKVRIGGPDGVDCRRGETVEVPDAVALALMKKGNPYFEVEDEADRERKAQDERDRAERERKAEAERLAAERVEQDKRPTLTVPAKAPGKQ